MEIALSEPRTYPTNYFYESGFMEEVKAIEARIKRALTDREFVELKRYYDEHVR